jgi:hypothetical protein
MRDKKFIYNHKVGFKTLTTSFTWHAFYIEKGDFNITVRGILLAKEKIIYLRINLLETDIEKQLFGMNLKNCLKYLKENYPPDFKIYNSYNVCKLSQEIQNYLLR